MRRTRYLSDYALNERIDDRGRIRTEAVYRGDRYTLLLRGEQLKKAKLLFSSLTGVILCAYLWALLTNAPCAHCWYVLMPMAVSVFPVFHAAAACGCLLTAKQPLTREENDRIGPRFAASVTFLLILSGISLAGSVVYMIKYISLDPDAFPRRNFVYPAAELIMLVCSGVLFSRRKDLSSEKLEKKA